MSGSQPETPAGFCLSTCSTYGSQPETPAEFCLSTLQPESTMSGSQPEKRQTLVPVPRRDLKDRQWGRYTGVRLEFIWWQETHEFLCCMCGETRKYWHVQDHETSRQHTRNLRKLRKGREPDEPRPEEVVAAPSQANGKITLPITGLDGSTLGSVEVEETATWPQIAAIAHGSWPKYLIMPLRGTMSRTLTAQELKDSGLTAVLR